MINNSGQTALVALLTGSGVDSTNNTGLWSEGSGTLSLVAREGSQPPGTLSGVSFSNFNSAPPRFNDAGQIAFITELTGSGVTSANNLGIWATDVTGA